MNERTAQPEASDPIIGEWRERIAQASAAKKPLAIRGGATKAFYGEAIAGDVFDTRAYSGIVDYDPTELVMTARAGTPIDEIEHAMRAAGQMLAFEPPRFDAAATSAATLGGCVAAGLSGPRRPYSGSVRDLVLGVRMIDGKGEDLTFGGRVMKNVAGFDVARLLTGSLGTLGVLTEVSFKCLPAPKEEATRVFESTAADAIRLMNEWGMRPLPISATCYHDRLLSVRLSGAPSAIAAATRRIGGDALLDADNGAGFWTSVRDQTHPYFAGVTPGRALWRLSVKSTVPIADLGDCLIEWSGALRWVIAVPGAEPVRLRAWAAENGGHATLFRATDKSPGVFHPLPATIAGLHQRLKAVFDPAGILNPGRMYATH
jgi:glycolate oxidase FAD binding subunit